MLFAFSWTCGSSDWVQMSPRIEMKVEVVSEGPVFVYQLGESYCKGSSRVREWQTIWFIVNKKPRLITYRSVAPAVSLVDWVLFYSTPGDFGPVGSLPYCLFKDWNPTRHLHTPNTGQWQAWGRRNILIMEDVGGAGGYERRRRSEE